MLQCLPSKQLWKTSISRAVRALMKINLSAKVQPTFISIIISAVALYYMCHTSLFNFNTVALRRS